MLTFQPEAQSAKSMTYDENGNMVSITNSCGTTNYAWDVRNRLVGINGFKPDCTSLSASFNYDALGRRIEKTINGRTIQYLYGGLDIVQEIENSAVSANYIRTLSIDEPLARLTPNALRFYQTDALGSVIALTDDTGAVKTTYSYDPFGSVTVNGEASDNPFQYTGRENDGTGLYYYRARYYSPELQRFVSEDPIRFRSGDVNFFIYVGNNSLKFIDPFGLLSETEVANIIYNETRSLSGSGINEARYNTAQAIYNGDEARGDNRPLTAPTTPPSGGIPSNEASTYQSCLNAAMRAQDDRMNGIDPTNGAMNFNFRNSDSRSPFFGMPISTQVGPLNNSYTGGGLNSSGVYSNTYGGRQ